MSWIFTWAYLIIFAGLHVWITVRAASSSACDQESARLECGPRERIAVRGVEYAVRKVRQRPCVYQDGDCRFRVNTDVTPLNTLCSGKHNCDIPRTQLNGSAKSPSCPGTALYRNIHYDCVPERSLSQICTEVTKTGQVLYLSNDNYPDSIDEGEVDCACVLTSAAGSDIAVNVIELTLTGGKKFNVNNADQQRLTINDSATASTFVFANLFGFYGYREIFRGGPRVDVRIISRSKQKEGRIFLEIKGESPVTVHCDGPSETPTDVQTLPSDDPVERAGDDSIHPQGTDDHTTGVSTGVNWTLIGSIVGAIAVALAVAVVIICLVRKRRRKLRRKSSDRQMDIREGVVDPFLVVPGNQPAVSDNRNGTNTFRPKSSSGPAPSVPAPPIPLTDPVGVYSTAGYSAPWETRALSTPPDSLYRNQKPSHYTYITPDILHHTNPAQTPFSPPDRTTPDRPTPAVRMSKIENGNGNQHYKAGPQRHSKHPVPEINCNEIEDEDEVFVDNSLYQSGSPVAKT